MTGPVAFAIDGKDETAWGIDVGPGRRNQPRKAVFTAGETDRVSRRHDPHVPPQAEPRRLEQRRQPEPQPRPVPAVGHDRARRRRPTRSRGAFGRSWRSRATSGPQPRRPRVFSYWRTTVPEWKDANTWIESLWRQHPEGTSQLVLAERDRSARRRTCSSAAIFSSRARRSTPGVPAFLNPLPPGAPRPG